MSYHYKKDGSLDMRYSSSKAAASSGYSGRSSGYSTPSYNSVSYNTPSYSSGLNYKKDGSLDMRYASSKAAVQSGISSSFTQGNSSDLNYKKDGSLDMRYASSKAAVQSGISSSFTQGNSSAVHLKKDGTPDMRYSSSKAAVQSSSSSAATQGNSAGIHLKKDGTPDMRYSSSKLLGQQLAGMKISGSSGIPLTKSGLPDMRTNAAREWVEQAARNSDSLPQWLPKTKDGSPDVTKPVVAEFLRHRQGKSDTAYDHGCRENYYNQKMADNDFMDCVRYERSKMIDFPDNELLPNTRDLRWEMSNQNEESEAQIPSKILLMNYDELKQSFGATETVLGKGSFGEVVKGKFRNQDVAVKRLHLSQLTKKERASFVKEISILDVLGEHRNLVKLIGCTLEPPCIVMEFVKLGSLNQILHYNTDPSIEAKITCGNYKKLILMGIVAGMRQVHAVDIVHGDLKPANVLLAEDFTPKITDFGLAQLRGKTSSTIASLNDGENAPGGTGAYMAPELLNSSDRPTLSCDVYSYGILLNEVIQEEQPYSDQGLNFLGRGPFAAVNYARLGKRPFIKSKTPISLKRLIEKCWDKVPEFRPSFDDIAKLLHDLVIPNSF